MLYPALAQALKEEGLNATLYGPKPHGFGIRIYEPLRYWTLSLNINGDLHGERVDSQKMPDHNPDTHVFELADPELFQKIKNWTQKK